MDGSGNAAAAATAEIDQTKAKLNALTGAEHFLIGLTPHYWAHIPMLIGDVHQLGLVNGVSCIVITQDVMHHDDDDDNQHGYHDDDHDHAAAAAVVPQHLQFIPVSKCTLVGVVVNVDHKSNGSILYLIDDGTGLMDCLQWNEN